MHTSIHGNTDFLSTKINIHTSPIGKIEIYGHKRQSQIPKENIFFYRSVRVHMIRNHRGLFLFMSQLLLLGKVEYGGGSIFKVVLEC